MSYWEDTAYLLSVGFVQQALIASALLGVLSGVITSLIVLRHMSFSVHATSELALMGAAAALLFGINIGFGAIIGCLFGGTLSDRFGRQSMIIIGEIGAAAALLVVSVLTDPVSLGAALFVYGAFASLPSPAIAASRVPMPLATIRKPSWVPMAMPENRTRVLNISP